MQAKYTIESCNGEHFHDMLCLWHAYLKLRVWPNTATTSLIMWSKEWDNSPQGPSTEVCPQTCFFCPEYSWGVRKHLWMGQDTWALIKWQNERQDILVIRNMCFTSVRHRNRLNKKSDHSNTIAAILDHDFEKLIMAGSCNVHQNASQAKS